MAHDTDHRSDSPEGDVSPAIPLAFAWSPEAIVISGADGRIVDANPSALALLGYARDELRQLHQTDLVPPVSTWMAERYAQFLRDCWWEGEVEVRTKHGPRLVDLRHVVLPDAEGGFHFAYFRDLRDHEPSEATRARLATLVTSSADAIAGATLDGIITDWNPAAARLFGYAAAQIIGRPIADLFPPQRAPELAQTLTRVLDGERIEAWETVQQAQDGRSIAVSVTLSPVRNDAHQIFAVAVIIRDISARTAAEAELAATHQHTREVLERITDSFYAVDREWRLTYLNGAAERVAQRPREDFLGHNLWDASSAAARKALEPVFIAALATGEPQTIELRLAPGKTWYEVRAYPAPDGLSVFFRDVTARKRHSVELAAALKASRAANETQHRFLAMMSHELRTPLQAILGYADLLLAGPADALTRDQLADIEAIRRGAGRMSDLVDQVLELSRIGEGGGEVTATAIDLAEVVARVRQDIAPRAAAKGLRMHSALPATLPPAHGDPMRVHQILLNLAGNAVKFTEHGEVRITAAASAKWVSLTVSDTGIGIAPDMLPQIFSEFRQAESGISRRYEGVGLGLAIAQRLAEQMGGRIQVTSHLGAGSTFTLQLPVAPSRSRKR